MVDFLGLQIETSTTAEILHQSFKAFLSAYSIPFENLVGLRTDGASNLCAVNKADLEFRSSVLNLNDIDFGTEFENACEAGILNTKSKLNEEGVRSVKQKV